jgi:DNA repair exonuclease SbcCD ATPase subunit
MSPPSGDNTLEWDGGKGSAVMQLSMKVAKLETFVRQLEKDVESSEGSKERLSKIESRLDVLAERLGSIEKDIDALDDLKSAARWINPKMLGGLAALLLGGSVAGNATLDAVTETHDEQKIEKVDQILQMLERNGHNG